MHCMIAIIEYRPANRRGIRLQKPIAKIQINDEAGLADLMDHAAYQKICEEEDH